VKELDREEEEEEPYLLKISHQYRRAQHCWMDRFPIKDHNATDGTALLDGSLPHQRS
jgi:hypothetical protein